MSCNKLMTKAGLLELIMIGENASMEFARDDLCPERLAKIGVAFANHTGGRILLGVDDDGTITGVQRANLERWVMDAVFGRYVHPMIIPFYEQVQVDGQHRVAVITISQGVTKPYVVRSHDREDIYIRVGSTSRLATREQQARLYALGGMLHAELLPVSGSGLADLSLGRLKDYLSTIVGDKILPASDEEWRNRLCGLGFMVEREDGPAICTIAGLVLFGHAPRRLLHQAGVRWMAFEGEDKSYKALDDRLIDGPLAALRKTAASGGGVIAENGLIENLVDAMRPFVSEEAAEVDASMRRERRWLYPVEALREAIVNALAHRDWTRYEEIEIARYADRLEVLSPGALQNSMTVEKMVAGQRSARNPLIVEVLRDYGYVDARGMGVRNKIIPLLKEQNGVEPEFLATEDYLKLIMFMGHGQPSEQLARLFQQRSQTGLIRFDEQPVVAATPDDLKPALWQRFFDRRSRDSREVRLSKLGLARKDETGNWCPTVTGILIASEDPRRWLPNAFVQAVAYRGTSIVPEGPSDLYQLDNKDIAGPADLQVIEACQFVLRNMKVAASKAPGRRDLPQFDMSAVFEAIVNAVAHRDYSIHGSKIRLRLFADRMELYSPGGLPNTLDIGSLPFRQAARNEALTSMLARCPIPEGLDWLQTERQTLMDKRGEGVRIVLDNSQRLSGKLPEYRLIDESELLLTIYAADVF